MPFLALGEDLEQQLGSVPVEFDVAEFVQAEHVHSSVLLNRAAQLLVAGRFGQFVDQVRGGRVADSAVCLGDRCSQADQQVGFAGA
nr:hypothetical protein [Streptomyces actinomycinicus]